jgi:hypothetical protein
VEQVRNSRVASCAAIAAHSQAEGDVVGHVEMREQLVVLKDQADAASMRWHGRDVAVVDHDLAVLWPDEASDDAQQRALPASRRPEYSDDLCARDMDRHIVEDDPIAVADRDVPGLKHRDLAAVGRQR